MPRARFLLTHPDNTETAGEAEITVNPAFVMLQPDEGQPLVVPHEQVLSLSDDGLALTLALDEGGTLRLSNLGHMQSDLFLETRDARMEAWEKGLFLHGVRLVDTFPAEVVSEDVTTPAEVRLYEDRLSVLPQAGDPFGIPYALVRQVRLDPDAYRVSVAAEGSQVTFGKLKLRTTEFERLLGDLVAASRTRTASLLAKHLPQVPATALSALGAVMGDGIAARREEIEALAPGAWERLESLVVSTDELKETYGFLAGRSFVPDIALGIKQTRGTGEEGPGEGEPDEPAGAEESGDDKLMTWFFCPVPGDNGGVVAQEITSEAGHATYFFRVADNDWKTALARLNRAMLSLNFKRRPIYEGGGSAAGYEFAVRHLSYLRDLRGSFAGRAIHTTFDAWKDSVQRILGG